MNSNIDINSYGKTDIGVVRQVNEDAIFISDDRKLMAVLDGVGGSNAGQKASELGIAQIAEWYGATKKQNLSRADLEDALFAIDGKIRAAIQENPALAGMATTACMAYIDADSHSSPRLHIVHIGDSRAYLRRKGALLQLTLDHSWHNAEILQGHRPLAEVSKLKRNSITHSLGSLRDKAQIEYSFIPLYDGDIVVLSTDGIHDYMAHSTFNQFLESGESATANEGTEFDAQQTLANIVEFANAKGGHDNASIILAKINVADSSATNLLPKHNSENWLLGKATGELVYGPKITALDDDRLESFYRLSTPAGHSLLVTDRDGLTAVLKPAASVPTDKAPISKTPTKSPESIAPMGRRKTKIWEYLIGGAIAALLAALAWFYFGSIDSTEPGQAVNADPKDQTADQSEASTAPSHLVAAKQPEKPVQERDAEKAETSAETEQDKPKVVVAKAVEEAPEAGSEGSSKVQPEAEPESQSPADSATEGQDQDSPLPKSDEAATEADRESDVASDLAKDSLGQEAIEKAGEVPTEELEAEVYTAGEQVPAAKSPQETTGSTEQTPASESQPVDLAQITGVNTKLLAAAKKKRIGPKTLANLMGQAEPLLASAASDANPQNAQPAYDSLAINYLTVWLLDNHRNKPSQDQLALIEKLVATIGPRHRNNSYYQTILAMGQKKLLGKPEQAIERLQSTTNEPSQYIYDNLALAQLLIDKKDGLSKEERRTQVLAAVSPLMTNDLNYMKIYRPTGDIAYINNFGRVFDYRGVYSYLRKNLPKKDSKFLNCRLQFLEMSYSRSCLNSVDTVLSRKSLQRYASPEDYDTLEKIYHLRFQLSRKRYKQAGETIQAIEQNKKTHKFDGYLAFAHAAIAESLNQDKDGSMKMLEQGLKIDPNFAPIQTAIANNTTVKTTF